MSKKSTLCGHWYETIVVILSSIMDIFKVIESVLKEIKYCKKIVKKHSNKKLFMNKDYEERFECHTSYCRIS